MYSRPSYGYWGIAAVLKRKRRSAGHGQARLLTDEEERRVAGPAYRARFLRTHDGTIVTSRSNKRWCLEALEFTCWNGEIVRVAFALDSHDREVISWMGTTAGITQTSRVFGITGSKSTNLISRQSSN